MDKFIVFVSHHPVLIGLFVILLVLFFLLESKKNGRNLSNSELTNYVNSEKAVVVDVRESNDFKNGHITNSLNIPSDQLKTRLAELNKHKDKAIILICNQGHQAGISSRILMQQGFTQVFRLKGGLQGWIADNLPVIKK